MIRVKVRVFFQATPEQAELEVEEGTSVEALLAHMIEENLQESGLGREKAAFLSNRDNLIVLLNGLAIHSLAGWKTVLQGGDRVSLLPAMAGG
jgi:molybdopterin converting factor small subunit